MSPHQEQRSALTLTVRLVPDGILGLTVEENNLCSGYPNPNCKRYSLCFSSTQCGPGVVPDVARDSPRMGKINRIFVRGLFITTELTRTKALDSFKECVRRAGE
jgi:hypothetical protein